MQEHLIQYTTKEQAYIEGIMQRMDRYEQELINAKLNNNTSRTKLYTMMLKEVVIDLNNALDKTVTNNFLNIKPMSKLSLKDLSPEQLAELKKEALAEEQEEQNRIREQRKEYKKLVNETMPPLFTELVNASKMLAAVKKKVYDELNTLVILKGEVYDREDEQSSHSFTSDDGLTIIIGHRINDGWDDTVNTGIKKVHDYLDTLGTDKKSKDLVKAVLQLLSADSKGTLKASRVLQLKKLAEDIGDKKFIDAINIIQDAYRPVKTKQFVTARYTNGAGEKIEVPLDISAANDDFKFEPINKEG